MEKKIYQIQKNTLSLIKNYLINLKFKDIKIELTPFSDFVTWVNCLGLQRLKLLESNKKISVGFLKTLFTEIFSIGKSYNYSLISPKIKKTKKINIVYSYCKREDFKKNYFFDLYFNQRSDKIKNTYWFLISLDNYIPKIKIDNIFILHKKKNFFNIFYLIKYFLKIFKKKNFIYYLNNTSNTSQIYSSFFYQTFKNKDFNLYLPFENRPHQNLIINTVKKLSKNNKVYGYYHRMPEPLQTEMFYKSNKIDYLWVDSLIQKIVFNKFYGWPKKKINVIKSLRHNNLKLRKNIIFLPYQINNINFFLTKLDYLNKNYNILNNKFKISIHPLMKKSKKNKTMKDLIAKKLINNQNSSDNYISVILGEPGSVAFECLDTYGKVIHITTSKYDIFSSKIWNNIKVKLISENIYLYEKKSERNYVKKNKYYNKLANIV